MRLEGHDGGFHTKAGCRFAHARQQRLVAPRCTPSKLPIVSAQGARDAALGSPRNTFMEAG